MEEGGEPVNPVIFGQHGGGPSAKLKLGIGGGIFLFVVVLGAILIVDSIHTIEEGNVGIYFVQGKAIGESRVILNYFGPKSCPL